MVYLRKYALPSFPPSWALILRHRYYFAKKFEHIIEAAKSKAVAIGDAEKKTPPWTRRISALLSQDATVLSAVEERSREGSLNDEKPKKKKSFMRKLRPDMIRRMDGPPQLVNPSGWISEGAHTPLPRSPVEPKEENNSVEAERPRLMFTDELVSSPKPIVEQSSPASPSPSHLRAPKGLVDFKFHCIY